MNSKSFVIIAVLLLNGLVSFAQSPVVAAPDPDALFTSSDEKLHRNKQAAYHIVKDLLECNHWDQAHKYIDKGYIQHNPNAADGLDAVVKFFVDIIKVKPTPIPEKMKTKVVSVVAEGDLVTVAFVKEEKHARTGEKYTTTWFDQWRFVDGKAIEHWDGALKM
jgi:predicted SnoaL-like aldol condensation-catalyzing enzyme